MKITNKSTLTVLLFALLTTIYSCSVPHKITEDYSKFTSNTLEANQIEKQKFYHLADLSQGGNRLIMTGIITEAEKSILVMANGKSSKSTLCDSLTDICSTITINENGINSILNNFKEFVKMGKENNYIPYKEIFNLRTVINEDVFINYRSVSKTKAMKLEIWVNGLKFEVPTNTFITNLKIFNEKLKL